MAKKIYRIEIKKDCTKRDDEIIKEFNANYAFLKYAKDKHYPDLCFVMGLSKNDGFMCKTVNANEGKRGRPKKVLVRDEKNPFYNTSLPHETDLHQHIYLAGNGSAATAQSLRETRNRKAKAKIYTQWSDNPVIPFDYVKSQSLPSSFRAVGNELEAYM